MADLHWPPIEEELLKQLTPVTRAVVKALGFGRASAFLKEYGGRPFNLPMMKDKSKAGLEIEEILRLRITLKPHLNCKYKLVLPKVDRLVNIFRDEEIMKNKDRQSITEQARLHNLSTRQVLNLRTPKEQSIDKSLSFNRSVVLTKREIEAMTELAYTAAATKGDNVYKQILNKLERTKLKVIARGNAEAQFDLF